MMPGLEQAEEAVQLASVCPVPDCPLHLERAEGALRGVMAAVAKDASDMQAHNRTLITGRLFTLNARLGALKKALGRSQVVLFRCSSQAGIAGQEYSPAGLNDPAGDSPHVMARL